MDAVFACLGCYTSDGNLLLEAAESGDADAAVDVLRRKPAKAWTAQQWGGQSAWHLAARAGHADVLRAMGAALAELPEATLRSAADAPSELLQQAQQDVPAALIAHAVQQLDAKGLTALHLACIKGHTDTAGVLMELGADPFAMDSVGRTPLHYAASWGFADVINAVLGHHSGPAREGWQLHWPNAPDTRLVDVRNASGFTPLHYAVWVGRKDAIQALASYDACLKVVNVANDYDWIRVGTGNTPLHLAAYGGDFDVVKLLLAAYVQSLSAGAAVMAAARGQWGERHTDDVRHMRNRRGWMAYHVAIHKGYQHLAELLHPDIPYTFIFSNDDMQPGSVRMFGPARLMVVAAKALQHKLVRELEAVAAEVAAEYPHKAAAAAAALQQAPAGDTDGDEGEEVAAAGLPPPGGARLPSSLSAPPGPAAAGGRPYVSPFAASSRQGWQASFSTGRGLSTVSTEAASVTGSVTTAAAGPPAARGPVSALTMSAAGSSGGLAGAAAGAAAADGAPPPASQAAGAGGDPSFNNEGGGLRLTPLATAPPALLMAADSGSNTAATGGAPQQGSSAVSEAGMSTSTVPGSVSAVAGTPPGSVVMGGGDGSSHHQRLPQSVLLSPNGQPVAAAGSKHRRVQSAMDGAPAARGGGTTPAAAAAGRGAAREQQQHQHLKAAQKQPGRRSSLSRRVSRREPLAEMLPVSSVQLRDSDYVDDAAPHHRHRHHHHHHRHRHSNDSGGARPGSPAAAAASAAPSPPGTRRISSMPPGPSGAPAAAAAPPPGASDAAAGDAGSMPAPAASVAARQRHSLPTPPSHEAAGSSSNSSVPDNPLNVMLAARALQIGQDPEAIRQQLLSMKLASGAQQFSNAVSGFHATLLPGGGAGGGIEAGTSARLASFVAGAPRSGRASFSTNRQQQAGSAAAAAAAPMPPPMDAMDGGGGASSEAAVAAAATAAAAAVAAAAAGGSGDVPSPAPAGQQQQPTMSPSPSLYNIAAVNVMTNQPSQSLQRLLSGNLRGRRAPSLAPSSLPASAGGSVMLPPAATGDIAALAAAGSGGGGSVGSGSIHAAPSPATLPTTTTNGDLPVIQHPLVGGGAAAQMIAEEGGADGGASNDGDDECEICFDAVACVALQACGHTLCVACCRELTKLHHFKPGLCPYCRQIICGFSRSSCGL